MRSILLHSSLLALSLAGTRSSTALSPVACPWCGAAEAPAGTGSSSRIAPAGAAGMPVEITGTVYQPDGRTPASRVLLYASQAGADGAWRGWARTDSAGHYRFMTVRPVIAPGSRPGAQVSLTVTPAGGREVLVAPVPFGDDASSSAGSTRGARHIVRDIVLERGA